MGTVFSFDLRGPGDPAAGLAGAVALLHHVDAVFSTYRPDSAVSRLGRGELRLAECPAEVREVLDLCAEVRAASAGCFDPAYAGGLDPTGVVKGWAVQRASDLLRAAGSTAHAVGGGGDVRLVGEPEPGQPWRVGIADPLCPGRLATVVSGRDLAVATSGEAERGAHIIDPRTGRPPAGLASVTVVGPDLGRADGFATAAFVLGAAAPAWLAGLVGYAGFGVTATGERWATPGFAAYRPAA